MAYTNLPYVKPDYIDGNLLEQEITQDPIVMVLGTAAQGVSEYVYNVRRATSAKSVFGTSGNLVKGMAEAIQSGAKNVRLYRIGATSATLSNVGGGITIETNLKDDTIGTAYNLFWDDSEGRLRIWRVSDSELVYDNNPTYPTQAVDLGAVSVSGTSSGNPGDIGTLAVPVTMAAAHGVSGAVYAAGTDGTSLSKMELYEALYNAYYELEDTDMDIVIPMNVYLDDLNVMDKTAAQVASLGLDSLSAYPTAGSTTDGLGKVYVEEYEGEFYFWWWFPSSPNADADTTFDDDSGANIYPSVGSADATTNASGTTLTGSDFHEVNFAYQMANFCYTKSQYSVDVIGYIGVNFPDSYKPKDIKTWVGTEPVTTTSGENTIISTNGTGLLGNKFMAGRKSSALDSGAPGLAINGVDGLYYGGFIATDSGWIDGTQLTDDNDQVIDIGKFIDVVVSYGVLSNTSSTSSYVSSLAASYAGFTSTLPPNSAPTHKVVPTVTSLAFKLHKRNRINPLAGYGYTCFHQTVAKGVHIADAPTAARSTSDYKRRSTVRIVKAISDALRTACDPFLGEGYDQLQEQALETRIDEVLSQAVKSRYLRRYNFKLSATPAQLAAGQAVVEVTLVPAFEMRQISIPISLANA